MEIAPLVETVRGDDRLKLLLQGFESFREYAVAHDESQVRRLDLIGNRQESSTTIA